MSHEIHHGDCLQRLKDLPDNSVDAIVTDPPYGLAFMGKRWDYDVPSQEIWAECLRVLKPGGHLLAFAGTRTQHRMAVRIEDAGFEIRDMIAWVYGSGFPKSMDVSKAIDKAAGAERNKVLVPTKTGNTKGDRGVTYASDTHAGFTDISEPVTDAARQWQGWGTALKPALEPITVARKPLVGTVAENVLAHGTGAINVDGCRVGMEAGDGWNVPQPDTNKINPARSGAANASQTYGRRDDGARAVPHTTGRWPANLIHDGSDEVVRVFPATKSNGGGTSKTGFWQSGQNKREIEKGDTGSAARFFYCAKASKRDRDEGLEGFEAARTTFASGTRLKNNGDGTSRNQLPSNRNIHPTVKPTDLMRYLCRLVTPPGGVVLDPFMGSGSTGKAAVLEGFRFIGIEREAEYVEIAKARINAVMRKPQ